MSKHWCPQTKAFTTKEYRDLTSLTGVATGSAYPTKDSEGNLLETEYGLCEYMDHQTVHLQEMPERAPPGQLPRSIEVSKARQCLRRSRRPRPIWTASRRAHRKDSIKEASRTSRPPGAAAAQTPASWRCRTDS